MEKNYYEIVTNINDARDAEATQSHCKRNRNNKRGCRRQPLNK